MKLTTATKLVLDELDQASSQHPNMSSCHEGYAILLEEVEELWAEVKANQGRTHRGVSEAVQIAAMALRYLVYLCPEDTAFDHTMKVVRHESTRSFGGVGGYSG